MARCKVKSRYHQSMQTIHIPETEAARNFAALMAHISAGSEVVIERDASVIAVMRPPANRPGLLLSEILARAKARGSKVTLDGNFGRDLEDAVNSHPEPMDPPEWD
jgi:antitoxin (DNA-binding transcriptional repressor) of toxin-antitoxin stability system